MPDIDPTPLTPITIGDRLSLFRGDIAARIDALALQSAANHSELMAALSAQNEALIEALNSGGGGAADTESIITAIQSASNVSVTMQSAILSAIGGLWTAPANYTVRRLLGELAGYIGGELPPIDDTGEDNPNDTQNPDPGGCGVVDWDYSGRITQYEILDTTMIGGVEYGIYAPLVPPVQNTLLADRSGIFTADPDWAIDNDHFVDVCLSWDFTGNEIHNEYARLKSDNKASAGLAVYDLRDLPTIGSNNDSMYRLEAVGGGYASYRFAAPIARGMPKNVFVHVIRKGPLS